MLLLVGGGAFGSLYSVRSTRLAHAHKLIKKDCLILAVGGQTCINESTASKQQEHLSQHVDRP